MKAGKTGEKIKIFSLPSEKMKACSLPSEKMKVFSVPSPQLQPPLRKKKLS